MGSKTQEGEVETQKGKRGGRKTGNRGQGLRAWGQVWGLGRLELGAWGSGDPMRASKGPGSG